MLITTTGLNTPYTSGGYYHTTPSPQQPSGCHVQPTLPANHGTCPGCGRCRCCGQPAAQPFFGSTVSYSGTNNQATYQQGTSDLLSQCGK